TCGEALSEQALIALDARIDEAKRRNERQLQPQLEASARAAALTHQIRLQLRAAGSDTTLDVSPGRVDEVVQAYARKYSVQFGFEPTQRELVIERVQVETHSGKGAAEPEAFRPE